MNLNNINYINNANRYAQNVDGTSNDRVLRESINAKELLNNASNGDIIEGVIVANEEGEVSISLGNDTVINAKLSTAADLAVGSSVTFSVKSSDQNTLILSPLYTNTDTTSTIVRALTNAGIPTDARSMAIVDSMMHNGMNIGKEEVLNMVHSLSNVETSDIPDSVSLVRLGVEPTPTNLEQFSAYQNYEHQIIGAVDTIIDMLPETIESMFNEGNEQGSIDLARDILDVFTMQGSYQNLEDNLMVSDKLSLPVTQVLSDTELTEFTKLLMDNGLETEFSEDLLKGNISLKDTLYVLDNLINEFATTRVQESEITLDSNQINHNVVDGQSVQNANAQSTDNTFNANDFLKSLSHATGQTDLEKMFEKANELTGMNDRLGSISKLIQSKAFGSLIKSAVNAEWKLNENQVSENKQVSDLYHRITEQTSRILDALNLQAKGDTPLANTANELSNNLQFMNELNHMFDYVQLPVRLSGNDAHGDLYVYSNKKHMASSDGTVSALLHLDMDNLGPTDIYVSMNLNNNVNTKFIMPDEDALDLIALHIDELTERLNKRGYNMSAEYTTKDGNTNVMDEILAENKLNVPISVSNFDAKA